VKPYVLPGAGKTMATVKWIEEHPHRIPRTKTNTEAIVVHVTTRHEITSLNTHRFLKTFGPNLPRDSLRKLRNQVFFTVSGYDDSELELFEIEEVRRYYATLHRIWPCWTYAGTLLAGNLRAIALCILPNLRIKRTRHSRRVAFDRQDMATFFEDGLPAAALCHHHAGINRHDGVRQLMKVADHLGLPRS
jgi:hypothetical protein